MSDLSGPISWTNHNAPNDLLLRQTRDILAPAGNALAQARDSSLPVKLLGSEHSINNFFLIKKEKDIVFNLILILLQNLLFFL
jgi:hypothetical protein